MQRPARGCALRPKQPCRRWRFIFMTLAMPSLNDPRPRPSLGAPRGAAALAHARTEAFSRSSCRLIAMHLPCPLAAIRHPKAMRCMIDGGNCGRSHETLRPSLPSSILLTELRCRQRYLRRTGIQKRQVFFMGCDAWRLDGKRLLPISTGMKDDISGRFAPLGEFGGGCRVADRPLSAPLVRRDPGGTASLSGLPKRSAYLLARLAVTWHSAGHVRLCAQASSLHDAIGGCHGCLALRKLGFP